MKNIINQIANNALRTFLPPCRERRGGSWVGAALLLLAMLAMSPTSAWAQKVYLYIGGDEYEISESGGSQSCTLDQIFSGSYIHIKYEDAEGTSSYYRNSSCITRENCSSVPFDTSSIESTDGDIDVDHKGDYTFTVSWTDDGNGSEPYNYEVSVTYPEKTYKITLIDDGHATFTSNASDEDAVPNGTEVTLTVTPVEGYCFYSLEDNHGTVYNAEDVNIDENGVATLTVTVTEDTEYRVYCKAITYNIVAVPNQSSLGTVSISPEPNGDGTYAWEDVIRLTATPAAGCEFVCWSDGEKTYEGETDAKTGINTLDFYALRNVTYTAIFRGLTSFDVIVKADGAENAALSTKSTTKITFDYADEVRTLNCYNLDKLSKTLTLEGMVKYDITLSDIVITAPDENETPDPDTNGTVWAGVKPRRTLRTAPALTRPALVLEGDEGSPYYLDADHTKITLHKTPEGRYVVNDTEVESTVTGIYFYNPHRMSKTDAVAATCTEPGNYAYWHCSDCEKYFTDDAGVNETTPQDQVIAPLGHDFTEDCNGFCTVCGGYQPATQVTASNCEALGLSSAYKDYYAIQNAGQLYWFADKVNKSEVIDYYSKRGSAVLTADIIINDGTFADNGTFTPKGATSAATPRSWTPIVAGAESPCYEGTFDGNGHTISGLYYKNTNTAYVGFVGCALYATIKNLGFENMYIHGLQRVGGICGKLLQTTISNCYTTGIIKGEYVDIGGICGAASSSTNTIINCYSTCKASSVDKYSPYKAAGGISGEQSRGVSNCYSTQTPAIGGTVTSTTLDEAMVRRFQSGEIAYLLNGSRNKGTEQSPLVWAQNLETQSLPVLGKAGVHYTRTMTDEWGTLVVPFAVSAAPEGFEFYGIRSMGDKNELYLRKVTSGIEASTPVFVRRTGSGTSLELTASNTTVNTTLATASGTALQGTYTSVALNKTDNPNAYFVYNDLLYSTSKLGDANHVTINPFRAYLVTPVASGAKQLVMVIDEETGIASYENDNENENLAGAVYNLQGQKLAAPRKGINIVNGKKVMVK